MTYCFPYTVISECSSVYCLNGGTCLDEQDGYKCDCPYEFFGKRCEGISSKLLEIIVNPMNGSTSNFDSIS